MYSILTLHFVSFSFSQKTKREESGLLKIEFVHRLTVTLKGKISRYKEKEEDMFFSVTGRNFISMDVKILLVSDQYYMGQSIQEWTQ